MTIDDGGPAFPAFALGHNQAERAVLAPGMSVRTWLTGKALRGMIFNADADDEQIADTAVRIADATIARLKEER